MRSFATSVQTYRTFLKTRIAVRLLQCRELSNATLQSVYSSKVAEGELDFDENQFKLIKLLNKISTHLVEKEEKSRILSLEVPVMEDAVAPTTITGENTSVTVPVEQLEVRARGLYIYGDVGIGKTVVMDMFYDNCDITAKKRVHFHQFMLDIHNRIHLYKKGLLAKYGRDIQLNMSSERDAVTQVAELIASECRLLCFDEFQVTDICDAMILSKLFSILWSKGTVLVATSNRPPSDLYKDGLNRAYFLPFIKRLEGECIVKRIDSTKDYRQSNISLPNAYYTPLCEESRSLLWNSFLAHSYRYRAMKEDLYTPGKTIEKNVPVMMGRTVKVTTATSSSSTCYVEFQYLCETDRGASDYHAICAHYDTVFLYGVPVLSVLEHDRARRFITLIDEIYDAGIHFVWTAENEPNSIFKELTPVEIISAKKEGGKLGTDHNWSSDPNENFLTPKEKVMLPNLTTNAWLDQSGKTDIYPVQSRKY